MASHVALSYVSVFAYTGSLIGPALVGFGSEIIGLRLVFTVIAVALMSIVILNHLTAGHKESEKAEGLIAGLTTKHQHKAGVLVFQTLGMHIELG